jgi:ABC-type nitrate/sulfonate/bicarbonate transport system substrate-binding protein
MNRRMMIATGSATLLANRLAPAVAQSGPVIRVGYTINDSGLEPVYAQEQGMFKAAGLNVELIPLQSVSRIAEALTTGAVDVGLIDCLQVANAILHGLPLAIFAGNVVFSKDSPTLVLVTEKSSAFRTAKDLENQTVGVVQLKSLSSSATQEWLRLNGADPAKVKFYELPFPDMNTALQRGVIAAACQGEPFLTAAKSEQRQLGVPFEAIGKAFYVNIYAATRPWLTANTAIARKLAQTFYDAGRWANGHRADSAAIESRYTKLPLETARTMARNTFSTSFDPSLIAPVLDLGDRYQLTPRLTTAAELIFSV